jgi:uncharacterized membrane protein
MQTIVGLFEARDQAEGAIGRLKAIGVSPDAIGVAMKDPAEVSDIAEVTEANDLAEEGATAGAVSGATVGTLVGLALVGSTFVLPGVGIFVIGGPLAAALAGAGIGAASGGILGALVGLGIPEHEARHYTSKLEGGSILVSAHVSDALAPEVSLILDEEGAKRTVMK